MIAQYIQRNPNGDTFYFKDKKMKVLHRDDGPAVILASGVEKYFMNGAQFTEREHYFLVNTKPIIVGDRQYTPEEAGIIIGKFINFGLNRNQ